MVSKNSMGTRTKCRRGYAADDDGYSGETCQCRAIFRRRKRKRLIRLACAHRCCSKGGLFLLSETSKKDWKRTRDTQAMSMASSRSTAMGTASPPTASAASGGGGGGGGAKPVTSLTQWNVMQSKSADQVEMQKLLFSIQNALRQRGVM